MENTAVKTMEEGLLEKGRGGEGRDGRGDGEALTWDVFTQETKRLVHIAGPMVAVILARYLLNVVSIMMVGHLGELALSSCAIAISLSNVTGFSLIVTPPVFLLESTYFESGMSGALETLCGQAYGAQQYRKLGSQTYTAIFSLLTVALVMSILWINMGKVLTLLGQDPTISEEAGKFTIWLLPTLYADAIFQPLVRYYQTQSLTTPMLISSCVTFLLHIPLSWALVYKSGLNNLGGALSVSISVWLNVIFLCLYMQFSSACKRTRATISMEVLRGMGEFFRFAIPSAVMSCLQWWSYEVVILLSGLLPNPQLETSVLSVCLQTIATLYSIPNGLSAGVSTRVSNELGAGNPQAARKAVYSVMALGVTEVAIVSAIIFATRHIFGYTFSNVKEVVDYVSSMAPLVCLAVIIDGSQGVLSGVARGCGWQNIGAYINLGSLYIVGVPAAFVLGFLLQLKARGLWIGIQIGAIVQTLLLAVVTSCTDWEKQAIKAKERLFHGEAAVENVFM